MTELAEHVRRLLSALGSVQSLEILLLVARAPERSWTAAQVAAATHVAGRAEPSLEKLARLNLVDVRLGNDVLYKYAPTSKELAATVQELAREYDERRLLVIELLVIERLGPRSPIAAFAEAFRIRRKKDG